MLATYSVIAYSYIHHSVLWFTASDEMMSIVTLTMLNSSTRKKALLCRSRLRVRSGLSLMSMMRKIASAKQSVSTCHTSASPFLLAQNGPVLHNPCQFTLLS